ncbi:MULTISPECIES: cytochrome c-type biogenesis protein [Bacteria]
MRNGRRQWGLAGLILVLLAVAAAGLFGGNAVESDRALALEQRLRCPVCKSVSIAESPSETATSMRRIVAEQVAAGRTDEQVIGYFTERYGAWILLDPPVEGQTFLLWLLPAVAAGTGVVVLATRSRRPVVDPAELIGTDRDRVQAALADYRWRAEEEEP